ncbi:Transposase and inactivated derivatives [Methylomonas albis]|uniref:Transposase n=1 Tax=Methylomonas albis TaxID=1854563 RepID=A0ABR9D0N7_9GAMM|nr:transposase [Methylomonas albis]MBD9355793.1 transposase [Methylomonas albis]CAD6878814.1 Transposase and inactivated derivatives [Methylomonas albis]
MRTYIRSYSKGGTYFFTVNLAQRKQNDLLIRHIDELRSACRYTQQRHPLIIEAMVVLPEHLHCIWRLPEGNDDYPMRWRLLKSHFSRQIQKKEFVSDSRRRKNERGVWQRRYWEHQIRDDADFQQHMDYIHYNPVKHGHVKKATDWPYSSIHRWINLGAYPEDWAAPPKVIERHWE